MCSSLIKSFIVFLICLLVSPAFGKSNETRPSRSFRQVLDKLLKSRKDKQVKCDYNDGKCLFVHDPDAKGDSFNDNTLQQCALDLCGPPRVSFAIYSYLDSDVERLVQTDLMKKWEKEFQDSSIEDLIKDWIDKEMASLNHLQKAFQESDMSRKSGFDYLKPKDYHKLGELFFSEYIEIDIDETRPLSERLIIHTSLPKEASEQLKEGLKLYAQDMKRQINTSLSEKIDYGIYTHKEAYPSLKNKWENFIKRYEEEKKSNGSFDKLHNISEKMKDMKKEMEHLAEEMKSPYSLRRELLKAASSMKFLEQNFTKEKTGSWPDEELLCQGNACQTALKEAIGELFSLYKEPLSRKNREDRYSATCLSQFILMKILERGVPEGLNIPNVKRNFSNTALKNFSEPTGESFENYINDGFHMGPLISKSHYFKSSLASSIKWMTSKKRKHTDNKDNIDLITDMYYTKEELEYKSDTPCTWPALESMENFFLIPQTISESQKKTLPQQMQNILSKGTINLSLFSCLHSHHGQDSAAHEMGHLLSWMFSQNKLSDESYGSYKQLRECATKKYKRLKTPRARHFTHENDQKYTEEDTADLIAYMAYPNSKTYFCSILEDGIEDSEENNEEDEDDIQYVNLNILNNHPTDPHSSSFLRVLSGAIHKKKKLSPACQQVVEQYKKDIDFTPCF